MGTGTHERTQQWGKNLDSAIKEASAIGKEKEVNLGVQPSIVR